MEIHDLIQNLQAAKRQGKLSTYARLLYYELVFFYKSLQITGTFYCSNKYLCEQVNTCEKTLREARNQLIKARLITYTLTRRQCPGTYFLPNPIEGYIPLEKETEEDSTRLRENSTCLQEDSTYSQENSTDNININNILYNQKEKINKKEKEMQAFEEFRRLYPGRKRGLETEFQYFTKKHADYETVLPLLVPAVERLIQWHDLQLSLGLFAPQHPLMQVWINQRRWEEELPNHNVYE